MDERVILCPICDTELVHSDSNKYLYCPKCKKLVDNSFYENAQPVKAEPVNAQQDESQSKDEIPVVLKSEFVFNEEKFTAYSGEYRKTAKALLGVSITALLVYVYPFISTLVSLIYNPRPYVILSFLCFACSITLVVFSSFIYKKRKTFEKSDIKKTAKHYIVGIVFSAISVAVLTYYIIDSLLLLRFLSFFGFERQMIIISLITSLSFFVPMFSLCLALLIIFSINLKKIREFIPPREKEQSTDDN